MDHYTTLGISKTATAEEIKRAYRKLASVNHPDKGGSTETFQKIQAAYDTLMDPQKRAEYDNPQQHQQFHGFSPFGGGVNIEEIFGQMFGGGHFQHRQQPMFRTTVHVTLEQAYLGTNINMQLQVQNKVHGVTIKIPKGVQSGMQLRYEKMVEGNALLVDFMVVPNHKYQRQGNHLISSVPISVLDLIIGTTVVFDAISGKSFEVTIPPKTQPNQQFRLTGQGMPVTNSDLYGDQILTLQPVMPENIPDEVIMAIHNTKTLAK